MMLTIPYEEYRLRIKKMQELLKIQQIDALFTTLETNFQYLYGSRAYPSERLTVAILTPKDAAPELICPYFEVSNFERDTPIPKENIYSWQETENPFKLLANRCKVLDVEQGTVALSPSTAFTVFCKIKQNLPKADFRDAHELFKHVRITKTEQEIALLQKAAEFSAKAIEKTIGDLKTGMTEKEISQMVANELKELSGEPAQFSIAQIAENTAIPHGLPTNKKLQNNQVILIDAGTTVTGYNGDITNTSFFGKPSNQFLEIYDLVEEANQRAIEAVRSKALPEEVDRAARDFLEQKGYGKYFTHRTGHGIGLEVHEDPYIVKGNKTPLEINQVHSIEPGIYLLGKFGVRIEDDVIVRSLKGERAYQPVRRLWEKN